MRKYKLNTYHKKIIADTITPVEVYLKIRDVFPNSLLLESSDYMSSKNNFSFICFNEIGAIKIKDFVLEEKELQGLKKYCQKNIETYVYEILKVERNLEFYITQSWCNYNRTGEHHHHHIHNNSMISGVFYVQTDGTRIQFHKGRDSFPLKMNFSEQNLLNSDITFFKTEANRLFLYPSTLQHSVTKNKSNVERISLAFNTFIKGFVGDNQQRTRLRLK